MRNSLWTALRGMATGANALATIALLASLVMTGGYAMAAKAKKPTKPRKQPILITGAHVKNNSLMGKDIKNGQISKIDFTNATTKTLKVRGDTGDLGPAGSTGSQGAPGKKGDTGTPAPRAFTFQHLARNNRVGGAKPNPNGTELVSKSCDDFPELIGCPTAPVMVPRWNFWCTHFDGGSPVHCNTTTAAVPKLTRSFQTLIVTADNPNGGLLDIPFRATLAMTATSTFYTKRSVNRQRLDCQLQLARVANGVQEAAQPVGLPITSYRHIDKSNKTKQDRLLNMSVTGAITVEAGRYDTFLACRAPDDDGVESNQLEFLEGNVIVLSTRPNGEA